MATTSQPISTIRLSPRDRKRLIEEIDGQSAPVDKEYDRRRLRVTFNIGEIEVQIRNPAGDTVAFAVLPRNLSTGGLSFIHGQFVHVGSDLTAYLPRLHDTALEVEGRVVRCRHIQGLLHEIGVMFRDPIELDQFVRLDRDQASRLAGDSGSALTGHVIVAALNEQKQPVKYSVLPQEITDTLLRFRHGRPFSQGAACVVGLTAADGKLERIVAKVAQCVAVEAGVYQVQLAFDKPINLRAITGEGAAASATPSDGILRTLIIDDSPDDRRLMRVRLAKRGFDVSEAYGSAEAFQLLAQHEFDIVLLDIFLDGECGFDVAKALRAKGYTRPIVALSADQQARTPAGALAAGCNAFLTKPVDLDQLQRAVHQLLTFDIKWEATDARNQPFGPIASEHEAATGLQPRIDKFVTEIGDRVDELLAAVELDDAKQLAHLVGVLKRHCTELGFPAVAAEAGNISAALLTGKTLTQVRPHVDQLVALLMRLVA